MDRPQPTDRFLIYHYVDGLVYGGNTTSGVKRYLWGRHVKEHWILIYEVPLYDIPANLDILGEQLYDLVLTLSHGHGVDIPVD